VSKTFTFVRHKCVVSGQSPVRGRAKRGRSHPLFPRQKFDAMSERAPGSRISSMTKGRSCQKDRTPIVPESLAPCTVSSKPGSASISCPDLAHMAPHHGPQAPPIASIPTSRGPWYFIWPVMHVCRSKIDVDDVLQGGYLFSSLMIPLNEQCRARRSGKRAAGQFRLPGRFQDDRRGSVSGRAAGLFAEG